MNLPTWATIVQALAAPKTADQLKREGFKQADLLDAKQGGHITCKGSGPEAEYSSTFKGRRSFSVVRSEQVIAHYRAVPSVAAPSGAPSVQTYTPPKWEPARPGATTAATIKSKGM